MNGARVASFAASAVVYFAGVVVFLGWVFGVPAVTYIIPGLATMKANTALSFAFLGASLLLLHKPDASPARRKVGHASAAIALIICGLTFIEYAIGVNLGIDELLFTDAATRAAGGAFPGRPSQATAFVFLLLASGVLVSDISVGRRRFGFSETLGAAAWLVAFISISGYAYGVQDLYRVYPFSSIALHTSLALLLAATALLLHRPDKGIVAVINSDGSTGMVLRALLPAAVMVPFVVGWIRMHGQHRGLYGTEFGLALFMVANVVALCAMIGLTARSLLRIEEERAKAQRALAESERSVATTLNSIGDGVIATDTDARVVRMNPVAERLTGWPFAEARGKPLSDIFRIENEDTRQPVESPVERVLREGVVVGLANHTVLLSRDGTERPIDDSGAPILDEDRGIGGVVLVFHDVTEAREAERRLRRSERRFARILESGIVGVVITTIEGAIEEANDAFLDLIGYTRDDLAAGKLRWTELTPPEWRHTHASAMKQLETTGIARPWVKEYVRKDGTRVPVLVGIASLTRKHNVGIVVDLTEQKRAEKALSASEARFARLAESGIIGIAVGDTQGNVVEVNDAYLSMTGYTRQEFEEGRVNWAEQTPPEWRDGDAAAIRQLAERGVVSPWEKEVFHKSGRRVPILVGVSALESPYNIAFIADLTERKKTEADLRKTEEQLRQSQKMEAIGRLAGGVAHDFNNLLTVIAGRAEILLGEIHENDPMRLDVKEIVDAATRGSDLTQQLLAFSRKQIIQPKVVDLNETIAAVERMLRRVIGEDVELSFAFGAGIGLVEVDPGQMHQVLMNLVVNARDAMPEGGKLTIETANVTLDEDYARTHVEVAPGAYVMIAVSDTGAGMDKETQARIFEPFFTTKPAGRGTGLGLATVFGILKQSRGHVWVYSERGKGTTFKLYLPRTDRAAHPETAASAVSTLRGTETILLVEDDAPVRRLCQRILERAGYRLLIAENGGDAVLICEQHAGAIDLLITDVVMPRMSGRELGERIQPLRPEMKTLFMSGYTEDAIVRHGVLTAGIPFVQKPMTPDALLRKVRQVLDAT
ncbi:PAS domain S-box protein [bacterium]|nr:PAS domain S-box protein [bacterium]